MTPETLREALFWDQAVCLDCEAHFEPTEDERCPACGKDAVYSAKFISRILELVKDE